MLKNRASARELKQNNDFRGVEGVLPTKLSTDRVDDGKMPYPSATYPWIVKSF
jgi:hypothetical protein